MGDVEPEKQTARLLTATPSLHRDKPPFDAHVLLVARDGAKERSVARILGKKCGVVEWTKSATELRQRLLRLDLTAPEVVFLDLELPEIAGDESVFLVKSGFAFASVVALAGKLNAERAARLLSVGVPSLNKPVSAGVLAGLALLLSRTSVSAALKADPADGILATPQAKCSQLESALESYSAARALSAQQRLILSLYLAGENDKQIARTIECSEPTVYEHWRRMGKKAGGAAKADVVADFHRFLARN